MARAADVFLRLVQEGAHEVRWSAQILEETRRTQLGKLGWERRIVDSYHRQLAEVFPYAVVSGYEHWIEQCTNDAGGRHVLACAIEARARYIVTFNTDDFKAADLARWRIRAMKPNDYFWMKYLEGGAHFKKKLTRVAVGKGVSLRNLFEGLLRDCPQFAERLLADLGR